MTKRGDADRAQLEEYKKALEGTKREAHVQVLKFDELLTEKLKLSAELERVLIDNSKFLELVEEYEKANAERRAHCDQEVQTVPEEKENVTPEREGRKMSLHDLAISANVTMTSTTTAKSFVRGKSKENFFRYPHDAHVFDRAGDGLRYQKTKILDEKLSQVIQKCIATMVHG